MAEPTENQLAYVSDIEAGIRAIKSQSVKVKKIAEVSAWSGHDPMALSQFVGRFAEQGHWHLIDRLAEAFLSVDIAPLCITRALEVAPKRIIEDNGPNFNSEPLELERELPMIPVQSETREMVLPASQSLPPEVLLAEVIQLINRLPQPLERKKVAGMTANWFGVGG
jgi:hypothetical protein